MPTPRAAWCLLLGLCALSDPAGAAEASCPTPPRIAPAAPPSADTPTYVSADALRALRGGISEFTGAVELTRGGLRLTAAHLVYDPGNATAEADGAVTLAEATGNYFETERLRLKLDSREGETAPARYRLARNLARGEAGRIEFAGHDRTLLHEVRYTTCAAGQDSWFLNVRELELDTAEDIGTARHAWVQFQGVPIFYFPYLSFPISDQRKSGFLMPRVGQSSKQGIFLETPYYLNLAPHRDATLSPRYMARRGLMLGTEFRYLGAHNEGRAALEYLPNDDVTGDDRAAGAWLHRHALGPRWSARIDASAVSDKTYLEDFGESLHITGQTHLPQTAALAYRGSLWAFDARLAGYQTVDATIAPADRPYQRLPQLALNAGAPARSHELRPHFDAEATYFTRDAGVTGARLNVNPALSLPLMAPYGYFTPKVGARYVAYNLSGAGDETPALTHGVLSLDTGLFFERYGERSLQTLEPRLFYLYVPARNQDALPVFDTGLADFSFAGLFRENRFSGGDRVGDTNQLTAALTTRFLDGDSGAERLRLSIGEIYYFADREVTLPAGGERGRSSDLAAEALAWLPGNWHLSTALQWDEGAGRIEKGSFYLQYHPERDRILNLGYRFLRDQLEQSDVSLELPLVARWRLRARSLYSLRDERNADAYAGLEYNACCWALRVFGARRYSDTAGRQVNSIQFEFELTGLSKLGAVPESPLRQGLFRFPDPAAPVR
jgi:LPS-assembly protein